jgi:hypothetical protein
MVVHRKKRKMGPITKAPPPPKKKKGGRGLGAVGGGGGLGTHSAHLRGRKAMRLPPVRCASAGAERREGGFYVAPAC